MNLNAQHAQMILDQCQIRQDFLPQILNKPRRTVWSWFTKDAKERRNMPESEVERLAFILNAEGYTQSSTINRILTRVSTRLPDHAMFNGPALKSLIRKA